MLTKCLPQSVQSAVVRHEEMPFLPDLADPIGFGGRTRSNPLRLGSAAEILLLTSGLPSSDWLVTAVFFRTNLADSV